MATPARRGSGVGFYIALLLSCLVAWGIRDLSLPSPEVSTDVRGLLGGLKLAALVALTVTLTATIAAGMAHFRLRLWVRCIVGVALWIVVWRAFAGVPLWLPDAPWYGQLLPLWATIAVGALSWVGSMLTRNGR